jgi:pimeloyl-ACP methyl ester carboxylesterase
MNKAFILGAVALIGVAVNAQAATEIPPGKWSFTFVDSKGHADKPMRVYTYRPAKCDAKCPMVFSIHGVSRTASNYRDYWELAADRYRLVIVAPEFSKQHWPGYNEFDVRREPDREKWAFAAIEHLFDEVGEGRKDYAIFGHSAGGQFLTRMAFYLPGNRASVMAAANPGWYAMPEWRKDKGADPFPYSLVETGVGESEVRQALRRRFFLLLGEKDTDGEHKDLRKTGEAMKQGANRLERGENYFKAVTAAAAALGEKLGWELREVPDVAHQGGPMSRYAADAIFGGK